ncbi:hypothetical protein EHQ96_05620 [Leptospira levettii]|uniref:Uncharacterized protein n=1 Tax=Leptospira levettii TaxID=2023178 RepID=A0ABY2MSM2_9LEPT|nr:hypothetical protein EHQ34_14345 [Leptospira levettii]TGL14055.1 hypothetical protein EHQ39_02600 [Leptospira levettii]TGL74417.1 hypothetical protein EHQ60_03410 [Leptospira levettii]TGM25384.1 hypothetical protein EHQ74_15475 [Leptospira levettii]TGM30008.1 hypothetical protein EHQ71_13570 [Leptospira levettii]
MTGAEVNKAANGSSEDDFTQEKLFPKTNENPIVYKILLMVPTSIIGYFSEDSFLFFTTQEIL